MADRPTGRDEVVSALIEAAADLFSERGIDGVSVRQIAERAGVNHGLVHRHFGSKEELARAVGSVLDDKIRTESGSPDGFLEALDRASISARGDARVWRFIARLILDGERGIMPDGHGNYLRALVDLAADDQKRGRISRSVDPRELVFMLAALGLGIEMFGDYLKGATGIPDAAAAELEDKFRDIILAAFGGDESRSPSLP